MPRTIPSGEPESLNAGDSWQWDKHLSAFPPSEGWTLSYSLEGPSILSAAIEAETASGGDYFEVRENPPHAGVTEQGTYTLIGTVSKSGEVHTIYTGSLLVRVFNTTTTSQTHAETMLALIKAALEGRLTTDQEEIQVNGRRIRHVPMDELRQLHGKYSAQVSLERNGGRPQTRKARFVRPA